MPRYALRVAYDGTGFRGFAPNLGVRTVAGELRSALGRILGAPPSLTCAGRTDAGVHASGQTVTFDADRTLDPYRLRMSLNGLCGPEIAVSLVTEVEATFDARFSCEGRIYRYTVLTGPVPDPLRRDRVWHVPYELDIETMRAASVQLLGTHDFSSFCRRKIITTREGEVEATRVRTLRRIDWSVDGVEMMMEIEASSFCQQMVRSITGLLVTVGRGALTVDDVVPILTARDRNEVPHVAPPQGLCLVDTLY